MDILRKVAIAFAKDGYHKTTVSSLANRLGVSKPVFYYYARNKDDLLVQCRQAARDALYQAVLPIKSLGVSGAEQIRYFFLAYSDVICSEFGRCFVMINSRVLSPPARRMDTAARREIEAIVRQILMDGQADGSIRPCNVSLTARALFGAFNEIPIWLRKSGELGPRDVAGAYIDLFISGLRPG